MPYHRRAALAITVAATLLAGCKSSDKPAQSNTKATRLFAVSVDAAAFFRHGPQPGRDPDLQLPKDTVVRLIRPSFGSFAYSKIEVVASGAKGYIASEEIRPASSTLLAAATTTPPASMTPETSGPTAEQFNLNSDDPRLIPPPEQLPGVDLPAPAPEP